MKKLILAVLAISFASILATGNALAADNADINVSATVLGTCLFDAGSFDLAFGDIDPASAVDATASVDVQFTCSNGTDWTLDDVSGNRNMTGVANGDSLAYSIAAYGNTGTGTGSTQTVTLDGTVAVAAFQAVSSDVYTETITININP